MTILQAPLGFRLCMGGNRVVCVRACVSECVRVCAYARMCVRVCTRVRAFAGLRASVRACGWVGVVCGRARAVGQCPRVYICACARVREKRIGHRQSYSIGNVLRGGSARCEGTVSGDSAWAGRSATSGWSPMEDDWGDGFSPYSYTYARMHAHGRNHAHVHTNV